MEHNALPSADRVRVTVLVMLAILGLLVTTFLLRRPLLMVVPACTAGQWDICLGTFNGVALLTLAALPLAVVTAWALAHRRRRAGAASPWRRSLAEVGLVYGTLPWVWITMLPGSGAGTVPGRVSLVPLQDLFTMGAGQVIGNLLVLAALGFLAPLRFPALASLPRIVALGAACSVVIEGAQYVLRLDRVSSVDDVILNAAGAGLAALASYRWWRARSGQSSVERPIAPVAAP